MKTDAPKKKKEREREREMRRTLIGFQKVRQLSFVWIANRWQEGSFAHVFSTPHCLRGILPSVRLKQAELRSETKKGTQPNINGGGGGSFSSHIRENRRAWPQLGEMENNDVMQHFIVAGATRATTET